MAAPTPVSVWQLAPYEPPRTAAAGGRARRADAVRQPHDGWTFVLVPPGTGARPRTLHISVRRLRALTAALCAAAGTSLLVMVVLGLVLSDAPRLVGEARGVVLGVLAVAPEQVPPEDTPPAFSLLAAPIVAPTVAPTASPAATPPVAASAPAERAVATAAGPRRAARPTLPTAARRARVAVADADAEASDGAAPAASHSIIESLPVIGRITSNYSHGRRHPLLGIVRRHKGVDIAAPAGTRITAPAAGRVVFAGRRVGFGLVVDVDHGGGVVSRYAHCRSIAVSAGEEVHAGQTIAAVGSTGLATGPHLHFELLVHGRSVDPMRNPIASLLRAGAERRDSVALPPLAVPASAVAPAAAPGPAAPLPTVAPLPAGAAHDAPQDSAPGRR